MNDVRPEMECDVLTITIRKGKVQIVIGITNDGLYGDAKAL